MFLRRGQDHKIVMVRTIDFTSQTLSSFLDVKSVFTVTERGFFPIPRGGRHYPPRTLHIESSYDESLKGRFIFEANGKPVSSKDKLIV